MGRLDRAEGAFAQAATAERAAGVVQGSLTASTQQVNVQRLRGRRRQALATGRAALAWAGEHVTPSIVGRLQTVLAELLLDENDLTAALPLATERLAVLREFGNAPPLLLASLPMVRLHLAQGDTAAADAVLAAVRPLVQHGPFAMVAQMLAAAEARVRLAEGAGAAAVASAAWTAPVEPPALADLFRFAAAAVEAAGVTPPRILIAQGQVSGDAALLHRAQHHLESAGRLERTTRGTERAMKKRKIDVADIPVKLAGEVDDRLQVATPVGGRSFGRFREGFRRATVARDRGGGVSGACRG